MNDMAPIPETTDLERAQNRVADIKTKLAALNLAIKAAHAETMKRNSAWSADGKDLNAVIFRKTGEARLLETELRDAKTTLKLVQKNMAERAKRARRAATAALPRDKWFEISTPDGRTIRTRHSTAENLKADLLDGYVFRGEVFRCDSEGKGGATADADSRRGAGAVASEIVPGSPSRRYTAYQAEQNKPYRNPNPPPAIRT
jgi:hypothetical protein